ncbi:phage tail assembly chaperone [Lysobacter soli]|uniref:phage tail assembly chaperone n=1 Tax=Lysobacter soli TaxID=453783 RepID=UPI0037C89DE9
MFKIKSEPTFPATITIIGQGREQKLALVFRHRIRTEYADLLQAVAKGEKTVEDAVLEVVESWEADAELSRDTLVLLDEQQPGACWAILMGYQSALGVARKGN